MPSTTTIFLIPGGLGDEWVDSMLSRSSLTPSWISVCLYGHMGCSDEYVGALAKTWAAWALTTWNLGREEGDGR
jgi:hypothetical protein